MNNPEAEPEVIAVPTEPSCKAVARKTAVADIDGQLQSVAGRFLAHMFVIAAADSDQPMAGRFYHDGKD